MSVRYKLIEALEPLGFDIALQGSFEVDDIPDDVITYRIADAPIIRTYNNKPAAAGYYLQVNAYTRAISKLDNMTEQIMEALLAAGFTTGGDPIDAGYDKDTGHYGALGDYYYLDRKEV